METSRWDIALAVSTVVLAVATIVLAAAAIWAARIAVHETRLARTLADSDVRRRRAEASHDALRRFIGFYSEHYAILVREARKVTAERASSTAQGQSVKRLKVAELVGKAWLDQQKTPEVALDALQDCLDGLEEIAVGVELRVYDEYVLFHGAGSTIKQFAKMAQPFIERARIGRAQHRDGQPTAYVNIDRLIKRFEVIEEEGAPKVLAGALDDSIQSTRK